MDKEKVSKDAWVWGFVITILIIIIVIFIIFAIAATTPSSRIVVIGQPPVVQPPINQPPVVQPPVVQPPVVRPPVINPPVQPSPGAIVTYQSNVQLTQQPLARLLSVFTNREGSCGNPVIFAIPTTASNLASNLRLVQLNERLQPTFSVGNVSYGDIVLLQFRLTAGVVTVCRQNYGVTAGCGLALTAPPTYQNPLESAWMIEGGTGVVRSGDQIKLRLAFTFDGRAIVKSDRWMKSCTRLIVNFPTPTAALSLDNSPDTFVITTGT